jgi:hypothetical protein
MTDRDLVGEARTFAEMIPPAIGVLRSVPAYRTATLRQLLIDMADKLEQLQTGGKFLGDSIVALNQIALDATGLHHLIDKNGDGDWQAVWENVSDLGNTLAKLQADRAEELAAIARKQQRDAAHIAELEAWKERQFAQARRAIDDIDRWNRLYNRDAETVDLTELIDFVLNERDTARAQIAEIRTVAETWATQPNDYDEDTEQQILDGQTILDILGVAACPHLSSSGNDSGRWVCDECGNDMGAQ